MSIAGFYNRYDDLLSVENRPAGAGDHRRRHCISCFRCFCGTGSRRKPRASKSPLCGTSGAGGVCQVRTRSCTWTRRRHPTSNDASTVGQLQGDSPQHKVVIQSALHFAPPVRPGSYLSVRQRPAGARSEGAGVFHRGCARGANGLSREFELSVVGQNLFQPHHAEYAGDPGGLVGIRRSVYLKLMWTK